MGASPEAIKKMEAAMKADKEKAEANEVSPVNRRRTKSPENRKVCLLKI